MVARGQGEGEGRGECAGAGSEPEVWRLEHPRHGALEVAVGGPAQLRTVDPGYPREKRNDDDDTSAAGPSDGPGSSDGPGPADEPGPAEGTVGEPAGGQGPDPADDGTPTTPGYVLLRDGRVVARARRIGNHKVSIAGDPPERGGFTGNLSVLSGPRVQMSSSAFASAVRQVTFREGSEVVHFDPPPGSAAEARLEAIAASPWKRVVYPVAEGVGRSGWAIAMIVLIPVIGRVLRPVLDWIAERMPDIDIPWPDISLPSVPLPDISLPSIDLPEVNLPGWVEFLLEYSKVWVPLLVGVAVAVMAVRHARKSRRIKKAWQAEQVGGSGRAEPTEQAARAEPTEQPGRAEPAEQPEQPGRGEASGPSD